MLPSSSAGGASSRRRSTPFDLASSSSSSSSSSSDRELELEDGSRPPSSVTPIPMSGATAAEMASLHSTTLVVTPPSPLADTHPHSQHLGTSPGSAPPVPPIPPSPLGVAPVSSPSWTPLTPTMAMSPIRATTSAPQQPQPPPRPRAASDDRHEHENVAHAVNLAVSDAQALALALQVAAAAANPNATTMSANTSSGGAGATTSGRTPPSSTTISSAAQHMSRSSSSLSGALASSGQLPHDLQQTGIGVVGSRPWSMAPSATRIAPSVSPSITTAAARSSAIVVPYSPSISDGDLVDKPGSVENLPTSTPALPASSSLAASDAAPPPPPPPPGISSATLDRAAQAKAYLASRYSMIMADPGNYNPLAALRRRLSPSAPRFHALQPPAPSFPFGRRTRFSVWEIDNQELADLNTPEPPLPPPSPPGSSRHSAAATSLGSVHPGPGPGSSSAHGPFDLPLFPIASSGGDTIGSLRSTSPHHTSLPPSHAPATSPSILASVFRRGSDPGGTGASGLLPHPSQLLRRDSSTSRVPSTSALSTTPGGPRSRTGSPKLGGGTPHSPPPPPITSGASGYGQPLDLGAPALLPPSNSVVVVVSDPDVHASASSSNASSSSSDTGYLGIDPASLYCGLDVPPVPISAIRATLANTLVVPPVFSAHVSEIDARALALLERIRASELAANEIRMQVAAVTSAKAPLVAFEPGVELSETVQVWNGALAKTDEVLVRARDRVRKVEAVGEELVGLVEDLEWAVGGEYLQTIKRLEDSAQGRTAARRRRDDTMLETAYTLLSYLLAGLALILWAVLLVIRAVRRVAWITSLPVRFVWSNASRLFTSSSSQHSRGLADDDHDPATPTVAMDTPGDEGGWVTRVVPSSLSTMAAAAAASEQVMYGSAGRVTEQIERFINPDEWKARIEQLFDAPSTARSPSVSMDPPSSIAMGKAGGASKGHRRNGSSTSSRGGSSRVVSTANGPVVSLGRPVARRRTQAGSGSASSPKAPPPTVIVTAAPQGGS